VILKINVEGFELTVLKELVKLSNIRSVVKIFLEFDVFMSDVDERITFLTSCGFQSQLRIGSAAHWDELWIKDSQT
jgi:hypothetical protein